MPTTLEANQVFQENGVSLCPRQAANARRRPTSALEMSQNSMRLSWTFEEVDGKLHDIMNIYKRCSAACEYLLRTGLKVAGDHAGPGCGVSFPFGM